MLSPHAPARLVALATLLLAAPAVAAPLVAGHRGTGVSSASNPWPENSLPGLARAFDEGADLVEIDVQLTADGVPVLWHDETVKVGGKARKLGAVLAKDLPLLVGSTGITAPVPRFGDALDLALARGGGRLVMDIELKVYADAARAPLVAAVCAAVRDRRAGRRVMFSSFDLAGLEAVEAELPGVESGLLGVFSGRTLAKAQAANARGAGLEYVIPSSWFKVIPGMGAAAEPGEPVEESAFVAKAHQAGFKVGAWTLDKASHMAGFAAKGYDLLITDEPDLAREVLAPKVELAAAD